MKLYNYIFLVFFFTVSIINAQKDKDTVKVKEIQQLRISPVKYNPLSPSKAAFYSAVFPGAGQIYNNRYWWQLPLIYGGMAASVYFYIDNSNEYDRFRTAFKRRKAGLSDEFTNPDGSILISDAGLESAQKQLRQNRDLSLLTTVLIYVLQIVEASVTAHLLQFDTTDDLSIAPYAIPDRNIIESSPNIGLTLKYSF